jgi:hypothetical protein
MLSSEERITMFPGPLAELNGLLNGTTVGETKTAKLPSAFKLDVPKSLMVLLRIFAYSKSTFDNLNEHKELVTKSWCGLLSEMWTT